MDAAAVHLQSHVGPGRPHPAKEGRQFIRPAGLLGELRNAREFDQLVDVGVEAGHEFARAGQPYQRNPGLRKGLAQGAQRRHGAQHVAQLQRPEYGDPVRGRREQRGRHGLALANRNRPMARQPIDSSGMQADVIARSATSRTV